MRRVVKKKTDIGTIVLHWTLVASLVVSVLTGLRIAADAPDAGLLLAFQGLFPVDNVWFLHIIAGVGVIMVAIAYPVYIRHSGLAQRLRINVRGLVSRRSDPWGSVNIVLHWTLFGLIVVQLVTGVLLHRGYGGSVVDWHMTATWLILLYVPLHVGLHFAKGGVPQLLRVLRPSALATGAESSGFGVYFPRSYRIASVTLLAAGLAIIAWFRVDQASRDVLYVTRTEAAPSINGDLSDAAWRNARPLVVHTQQGGNLDETGASTVEIRAVHDGTNAYFAFTWDDSTRSAVHYPLLKGSDGWHVLMYESQTRLPPLSTVDAERRQSPVFEGAFAEDKFSVMLTSKEKPFGPGAFHPGQKPLKDKPGSASGRGLHYTTDGSTVDAWLWHAVLGPGTGRCEADHIGGPQPATGEQMLGLVPYKGGIFGDPSRSVLAANYKAETADVTAPVIPVRLPADLAALQATTGRFPGTSDRASDDGARWALTEAETVPYSAARDSQIPVGTIIPGVLIPKSLPLDGKDVVCSAHWAANRWTLTTQRRLETGQATDIPIRTGTFMFVAAFDHTVARHTRHIRPIKLKVQL